MPIYVDDLRSVVITTQWPYSEACHLFGNNRHELHDFAYKLSLRPHWFQNRPNFPHYDLTRGKREQAIRLGAIPATDKEVMNFHRSGVIDEDLDDGN